MTNAETTLSQYERHRLNLRRFGQVNKVAIFDALAAQSITEVLVEFDGESDQGQIESVIVVRYGENVAMPETTVTIHQASWGSSEPDISECELRVGIETLCYDFLEEENGGWENNDGAFGQFHLDVTKRTVELELNSRFSDITTSHHSF
jgi:hypothetical protein